MLILYYLLLKLKLEKSLEAYNETHAIMSLVLFENAMRHVCRIARILMFPGGNALLIGVGGSGKQSLSRLASFISNFEVKQLQVTGAFKEEDFDRVKKQNLESISAMKKNAQNVGFQHFSNTLFGDTPFGRIATKKTVKMIKLSDVKSFYKNYSPNVSSLVVWRYQSKKSII